MGFAVGDHHPLAVGAHIDHEAIEVREELSHAVGVLAQQRPRRFAVRSGGPGLVDPAECRDELAASGQKSVLDAGVRRRHLGSRVERDDPLQHGGAIGCGPVLAVVTRGHAGQVRVDRHRVPLVEASEHIAVDVREGSDDEVEAGLLTQRPRGTQHALQPGERGVGRAVGGRDEVRSEVVDRQEPGVAGARDRKPVVAAESDRLVDELDRGERPSVASAAAMVSASRSSGCVNTDLHVTSERCANRGVFESRDGTRR